METAIVSTVYPTIKLSFYSTSGGAVITTVIATNIFANKTAILITNVPAISTTFAEAV